MCEARKDLAAWLLFKQSFIGIMSFLPVDWTSSDVLHLASDEGGFAFGAMFGNAWIQGHPSTWQKVHISIKEILPIVLAARTGCTVGQQAYPPFHGQHSSGGSHQ